VRDELARVAALVGVGVRRVQRRDATAVASVLEELVRATRVARPTA